MRREGRIDNDDFAMPSMRTSVVAILQSASNRCHTNINGSNSQAMCFSIREVEMEHVSMLTSIDQSEYG